MSTAMPQVPPRPTRAQDQVAGTASSVGSELPKIPPRPINRRLDRSVSPSRESFARSPLNETPFLANHGNQSKSSLYASDSANNSHSDLPQRPASVVLPSIGQEGNEYADVFVPADELGTSPTQTRQVANDLKLHAPKPSLPVVSAKQRVSTVTRTDSGQAAAFGLGKPPSIDDKEPASRPLKTQASFASEKSIGTERPPSSLENEHGIPVIGQIVPMYPNAGDVQAPSPAPFAQPYAPGIGFHNDGSKPRHHGRNKSARAHDVPLDAYGRYGHGVIPHDRFEKAYYEKHPELFKKELGQYGEGKPEWAMSSDDLNKIVRDTASRGAGLGTSPAVISTPSEQIGFQASEEYASRMSSPRPQSAHNFHLAHGNASDTHVDSPLRKESIPGAELFPRAFEGSLSRSLHAPSDVSLLESEAEDDDVIHVDAPGRRTSKIYGGEGHMESTEDLGPNAENHGNHDEHGYSAPILASDEVAKEPFGWELQPAVSPLHERHGGSHEDGFYHQRSGSQSSLNGSRPSSRPGSIYANPGFRMTESKPLEDLEEYEPLFPEDEKKAAGVEKPLTAADKLKRPEFQNRKFPSQDIWEDSPNSLQYTATVSTPQLPEDEEELAQHRRQNETPAQAFARKQEELAEAESRDSESFLHREKKPWAHKAHLIEETRPSLKQRFPSRDIWEDTPDSLQLQTTVTGPQSESEKEVLSPPEDRPTTGAVTYHQEKAAAGLPLGDEEGRATTGIAALMKPDVPARPTKSKLSESDDRSQPQPIVPERPQRSKPVTGIEGTSPPVPMKSKPVVPARPSKPITRESSENVPLSTIPSNSSARSVGSDTSAAAVAKPKPPVPSRPLGSKIAALQGGFMSDLNKRLQLGPQAPKKEEPAPEAEEEEKEKAPLADARKGRARGPARRAPAKSPAPANATGAASSTLSFSTPSTLWSIDPEKDLVVALHDESVSHDVTSKAIESETPTLATNTAGQPLHEPSEVAPEAEKAVSPPSAVADAQSKYVEDIEKDILTRQAESGKSEPIKPSDEPAVVSAGEVAEEEPLAASTATLKPESENVE